ncbi:MAG TPA: hypothetical protein VIG66_07195, partial [Noviherbaspirillum sp.]
MPINHPVSRHSFVPASQGQRNTEKAPRSPRAESFLPGASQLHPNQLQHPPGEATQARLLQQILGTTQSMRISEAAWNKVNNAPDTEMIRRIAEHVNNEGLGNVVWGWGAKPVLHIEGSEEEGVWEDMKWLLQEGPLNKNFKLVQAESNLQKPAEEHNGYLINRQNLVKVVEENKGFFCSKFGISDLS